MKLFLDDIRHPQECSLYMHTRIGKDNPIYLEEWEIARNYDEFVKMVKENAGIITHVSFDHDLADIHYDSSTWTESFQYHEKTGCDCAKWFREYYQEHMLPWPVIWVHSMNPIGCENIKSVFR